MSVRVIVKEANSLDEARTELYGDDLIVLEELILCHGKVETIEGIAESLEEAVKRVRDRVPAGAEIEMQEIKASPNRIVQRAKADDEESAGKEIQLKAGQIIEKISLWKKGRQGVLGFFKSRNSYDLVVFQQAIVELRFREKARLQATLQDYFAEDLLETVCEARRRNLEWEEILQLLNPKHDPDIQQFLDGLRGSIFIDLKTALNILENVCRQDEGAKWQDAMQEAHKEASHVRAKLWIELRGLDAELADVFMFYTSIDWYPKSNREPTGIPMHTRISFGRHAPDERYRETIPYYSTDKKAFSNLERRAKEFGLSELTKQLLDEDGQDEHTATLRQKCATILQAQRLRLKHSK